jgi:hypothetical protein
MQNKIESRTDHDTNIKGNPFEVLKAIKQHALNYHEHRYEMSIILDAMTSLLLLKQKEGKELPNIQNALKQHVMFLSPT